MARIGATFGFAFALGLLFVSFEIVSSGKIHLNINQFFNECRTYLVEAITYIT